MIPRTFHRVWFGAPMPEEFRAFGASWVRCNPGWTLREWGAEDLDWIQNRELWDAAPDLMPSRLVHRFRSNLARVEILHRFGGVYVDCDFEALAPLEPHIEGIECFGVEEKPGLLANGIIGAVPEHPLLKAVIDGMAKSVAARPGQPSWKSNGQQHIQRTASRVGGLTLLPTRLFYPYHHDQFSAEGKRPDRTSGAVAHHVWASRRKSVSVIVPWRDPDPHRERIWAWLFQKFEAHPDWQIVLATDGLEGEFSRSRAIMNGVRQSFGDVIVVSDADVWSEGLVGAVDAVRGGAKWAIPHRLVHRLTEAASERVIAGEDPAVFLDDAAAHDEQPYRGRPCGGLVVLPRAIAERIPPDARFVGWGGEDDAWALALKTLAGRPWRGEAPLWHLWHPPQPRLSRSVGSEANIGLVSLYAQAMGNERRMRQLIDQAQAAYAGITITPSIDMKAYQRGKSAKLQLIQEGRIRPEDLDEETRARIGLPVPNAAHKEGDETAQAPPAPETAQARPARKKAKK